MRNGSPAPSKPNSRSLVRPTCSIVRFSSLSGLTENVLFSAGLLKSLGFSSLGHPEEAIDESADDEAVITQLLAINPQKRRYEEDREDSLDSDHRPAKRARFAQGFPRQTNSPKPFPAKLTAKIVGGLPLQPQRKIREIDLRTIRLRNRTKLRIEKVKPRELVLSLPNPWTILLKSKQENHGHPPRISVEEALAALQSVCADHCVLFVPSHIHCEKEFRCFRVDGGDS